MSDPVLLDRSGAVVRLTLNRPEARNALNLDLVVRLLHLLEQVDADTGVRAVILTGVDPVFCGGADLREVRPQGFWELSDRVDLSARLYGAMQSMAKPVIAAVNGHALAGGCGLAMSCDMVVAAEDAAFGYPEVQRGLVAALIMVNLARFVGRRIALDLLLTGRRITAGTALEIGLVNRVVPKEEVLPTAASLAEQIAAFPPGGVSITKRLFYSVAELPHEAALARARDQSLLFRQSGDALEGARAFFERGGSQAGE